MKTEKISVRTLAATAVLGAVAAVLMYLEFPVPFLIPSFVKFDFSDLPALLAAYSMGPISGIAVCLIKCTVHLLVSSSAGIGELANFIIGICFVFPSGIMYRHIKTRKGAIIGALAGTVLMAAVSLPVNYYITYPFYMSAYGLTKEIIIEMYQAILPFVKTLPQALLIFNVPFTFMKGAADVLITFLIYKKLSPILHEKR